jgi:predicted alpha/beta-fold hydrolase
VVVVALVLAPLPVAHYLTRPFSHVEVQSTTYTGYDLREIEFQSDGTTLRGWFGGPADATGVVVIAHGMPGCFDASLAREFLSRGYQILFANGMGCCTSDGRHTGHPARSAVDVAAALDWLAAQPEAAGLPRLLWGVSYGGGGVVGATLGRTDVTAVVSVAGAYSPLAKLDYNWRQSAGPVLAAVSRPYVWLDAKLSLGRYGAVNAIDAINAFDGPVLVAQGTDDPMTPFAEVSIAGRRDQVTNPRAEFLIYDQPPYNGHANFIDEAFWERVDAFYQAAIAAA